MKKTLSGVTLCAAVMVGVTASAGEKEGRKPNAENRQYFACDEGKVDQYKKPCVENPTVETKRINGIPFESYYCAEGTPKIIDERPNFCFKPAML